MYDSPDDPLLLCDGCDVPVHLSCEGLTEVPSGDWFCATCQADERDARCRMCFKGLDHGPMKPTSKGGDWCHTLCVMLVPDSEASFTADVRACQWRRRHPSSPTPLPACLLHGYCCWPPWPQHPVVRLPDARYRRGVCCCHVPH